MLKIGVCTTSDSPWNKKDFWKSVYGHWRGLQHLGDAARSGLAPAACDTAMGFQMTNQNEKQNILHPLETACPLLVALEQLPGLKPITEVIDILTEVTHS